MEIVASGVKLERVEVPRIILAEGLIYKIDLGEISFSDHYVPGKVWLKSVLPTENSEALVLTFVGENGYFVNIFDYRRDVIKMFNDNPNKIKQFVLSWQSMVPCLGTMRERTSRYVALCDPGDPKCDIVDDGRELALLVLNENYRKEYRVVSCNGHNAALHFATRISICELRPTWIDELAA